MPYRMALLALAVGLMSLQSITLAEETGEPIPDTIYWDDHLQFVAIDRLIDSSGRIDADVLGNESRASIIRNTLDMQAAANGCVSINNWTSGDGPGLVEGAESLSSYLLAADHVLIGRVLGQRAGYQGRLGHALLVETEEVLVGAPEHRFHFFYPKGKLQIQGREYCLSHHYYPAPPAVGDRVLVMHQSQLRPMLTVGGTGLIVLPEHGVPGFGKYSIDFPESDRDVVSLETSGEVISWAKESLRKAGKL